MTHENEGATGSFGIARRVVQRAGATAVFLAISLSASAADPAAPAGRSEFAPPGVDDIARLVQHHPRESIKIARLPATLSADRANAALSRCAAPVATFKESGVVKFSGLLWQPIPGIHADGRSAALGMQERKATRLRLGGQELIMYPVARTPDISGEATHLSLALLNFDRSFARFTSGPGTADFVGTIVLPTRTLRLFSRDNHVEIYEMGNSLEPAVPRHYLLALARCDSEPLARLELLHARGMVLADTGPLRITLNPEQFYVSLQYGRFGKLHGASMGEILDALRRLPPLISIEGREFSIVSTFGEAAPGFPPPVIRFEETFDGIHVDRRNEVRTDAAGNITEITIATTNPALVPPGPFIDKPQAVRIAKQAIVARFGAVDPALLIPADLRFQYRGAGNTLLPMYRFGFSANNMAGLWVSVDALTGHAEVRTALVH